MMFAFEPSSHVQSLQLDGQLNLQIPEAHPAVLREKLSLERFSSVRLELQMRQRNSRISVNNYCHWGSLECISIYTQSYTYKE